MCYSLHSSIIIRIYNVQYEIQVALPSNNVIRQHRACDSENKTDAILVWGGGVFSLGRWGGCGGRRSIEGQPRGKTSCLDSV